MNKIDVVITWVDGSDPQHKAKRQSFQKNAGHSHAEAIRETRFGHCGEIYYCIASILKYAAFVNRIWIITDNQTPEFLTAFSDAGLCAPDFIQIVDHTEVFRHYEDLLPTFNSLSIEAVCWRIPGLAEHFIYMNDDFFINQPLDPEFFFTDGKPNLRGWMATPSHRRPKVLMRRFLRKITFRRPNSRPSFRLAQEAGSTLTGNRDDFLHVGHHPHPMRKSVISEYFKDNPGILAQQIAYRFRDAKQYLPVSLANHLEIMRHATPVLPIEQEAYFQHSSKRSRAGVLEKIRNGVHPYGCLQSLDETPADVLLNLRTLMSEKFGPFLPADIDFRDPDFEPPVQHLAPPAEHPISS